MEFKIQVGSYWLQLSPKAPDDLLKKIRKKFKYRVHGYQFTPSYMEGRWDGYKNLFYKRQSAKAGCCYRLAALLKKEGHTVDIEFENKYAPLGDGRIAGLPNDPSPFQVEAKNRIVKYKYGIIQAKMRAGKTAVIAMAISQVRQFPIWVVTYGKDLVKQAQDDLEEHLEVPVGSLVESKFSPGDIIVTSYQAAQRLNFSGEGSPKVQKRNQKILESIRETRMLFLDECHLSLSPETDPFVKEFRKLGYKIGLSATPKPDLKSMLEVEANIGPVIYRVGFKKLIKEGRIAQPVIIMYDLPKSWYTSMLSDPSDLYEANIVDSVYRNNFIAKIAKELKKQNKSSFIIVNRKAHGETLKEMIPGSVYVWGDIKADVRKKLYNRLENKEIFCIISTVGKLGLNIPRLDAVINAEGFSATTSTQQKMRSLTAPHKVEKNFGLVIDFMDKGPYSERHGKSRLKQYKDMKGFIIKYRKITPEKFNLD